MKERILTADKNLFCSIVDFKKRRASIGSLRYKVFVESLNWIKGYPALELEVDGYDSEAIHLAVFSKDKPFDIIVYARILEKGNSKGLMLENDFFKVLLPKDFVIPPLSIEVSRFCMSPLYQKTKIGYMATGVIFRAIFNFMEENGYSYLFAAADGKNKRSYSHKDYLLKLFDFKIIGQPCFFQKNIETYALLLYIEDIRKAFNKKQ